MQKTLIAFSIMATAAGAVNATTIYHKDGTKINLDGRLSLEIANFSNKRTDLIDRGSRLRLHAYQDIGSGFSALANVEFRFSNDNIGDNLHTKRLYAGIRHKQGTLTFGKQALLGDSIGYSNFTYELGKIAKLTTAADKSVSFLSGEFNGFRFGADYLFGSAAKHADNDRDKEKLSDKGNGFTLALFYRQKFDQLTVEAAGGYGEKKDGKLASNEYTQKLAGTSVRFAYGPAAIGFDWAHAKSPAGHADHRFRIGSAKFEKLNQFELGMKYHLTEQHKVYAEYLWGTGETKGKADGDFSGWFLGADHKFNQYVVIYVEGGTFKTKQAGNTLEKEKRIALGSRVYF